MTHAQKPDFFFRRNRQVNLNRQGASVQSTTGSRGVRIRGINPLNAELNPICHLLALLGGANIVVVSRLRVNAGYIMFRGSVKSTGYPLHASVSPSIPLPCVTVCHHFSTGLYNRRYIINE